MSIFSDNVCKLRTSKGLSQRALAKDLDVSSGTVGNWESSNTLPSLETITEIAKYFGVSIGALFWEELDVPSISPYTDVKVFGRIAAGTPIEMEESESEFPAPVKLMKEHPKAFFLTVEGESMNKALPNGSYALIDPAMKEPIIDNDAYALCINGHDATIKRVRKLNNGFQLVPDSTDPTYMAETFNYNEPGTQTITVIGKVVWYVVPFDFDI